MPFQLAIETVAKTSGLAKNLAIIENPQFQFNYYETW